MTVSDVNECNATYMDPANASFSLNDCHENATCNNLPGTYECVCKDGYVGDGKMNCEGKYTTD